MTQYTHTHTHTHTHAHMHTHTMTEANILGENTHYDLEAL